MSRWKAAALHLSICVGIAAVALSVMLLVWYPWPLFEAFGGNELVMILVAVDVVIGPLLTLIVFKSGKWGMKFDLVVIGMLQVAALVYGSYIVFLARPAFIAYVKDRFEVAVAAELGPEVLAEARLERYRRVPVWGPELVATDFPTDPIERNKLVELALAGFDMHQFPRYYEPYAERRQQVLSTAMTPERFRKADEKGGKVVDEWLQRTGTREEDVRCVLLRARKAWVAVVLDAKTAEPIKMLISEKI
jgi:hypothetical protein